MGVILSRIITRKDDKTTTDTRSTNLRKRWSWRSNKKSTDITGTTVNRSSTMPTRSRLQTTEEVSEDRKHDDIFDDDHNEMNDSNIKSNESNHTIQPHSNEQQEQMNVACLNKSPINESPIAKDENQSNEISPTNQIENKGNITQTTISTNEANLLISHVLPNQEGIDPSKNMTISETTNSLIHDDNINVDHIHDLLTDKQNDVTLHHSTHDTSIMMNPPVNESTNNIHSFKENNIHSQTNQIIQDGVGMEQTLPIEVPSEKIEEFIHQETSEYGSNEQLKVENDNIKPKIEEIINSEDGKRIHASPGLSDFLSPVDMNEQIYNQPTTNIDSSETFKHSDLVYETVEQRDMFACSAEPSALQDPFNKEALQTSELIDTNDRMDSIENENIVNDTHLDVDEPKKCINSNESQICSTDESINLNKDTCVEQTEDVMLSKNFHHEESMHEELISNEPVECLLQPHMALNPPYSETSIITEPINVNKTMDDEQTESIPLSECDEQKETLHEKLMPAEPVECFTQPEVTFDPSYNESPINLSEMTHDEQTDDAPLSEDDEHKDTLHEEIMPAEPVECFTQPEVTFDPSYNESPINLSEMTHDEQTDDAPLSEDDEHKDTLHEEIMPAEPVECFTQPEVTFDPSYNESPINLSELTHDEQTDDAPLSEDVEHKDTLHEEIMPAEPVECFTQPEVTFDSSYNESPINLSELTHDEQTDDAPLSEDAEHKDTLHEEIMPAEPVECFSQSDLISTAPHSLSPSKMVHDINFGEVENVSNLEYNVNNDIPTEELIHTKVTDGSDEYDNRLNLSLNEPYFGLESNQDNTTDNIHHEGMNSTEPMVTFDNSFNKSQNTLNSIHTDDDQHQISQEHHENHDIDIPLNSSITDTHLHTDLMNSHDIQQHPYENFNSLLMNNENKDKTKKQNGVRKCKN
ncbi:hypothetical protein KSF78_0007893 [Schistosoma japonicum]|nr:hypothetical protein KSF78_0007893 [Schistosoma japonicum]